jgi:hypothetical protein
MIDYGCHTEWYEIDEGRDFLTAEINYRYDWIITNFPWSIYREFLNKSMLSARNIVSLAPINHNVGTEARISDIYDKHKFFIREFCRLKRPSNFPSSGFSYAATWISYEPGDCKFTKLF